MNAPKWIKTKDFQHTQKPKIEKETYKKNQFKS